jgi:hypothetical protein
MPQTATRNDAIAKARTKGEPVVVVEMDHNDGRRRYIVAEQFINTDEFSAFDGEIIGFAYPNGEYERAT